MSAYTFLAFDDWVQKTGPGSGSASVTSSQKHDEILGLLDQIAFEVNAAQGTTGANPSIEVRLLHSADGEHWRSKSTAAEVPNYLLDSTEPDLNVRIGLDDGLLPSLRFVRFQITITAAAAARARVRIHATLNDVRENAFARKMVHIIRKLEKSNPCTRMIQGGTVLPNDEETRRWVWELAKAERLSVNGNKKKNGMIEIKCEETINPIIPDTSECRFKVPLDASICIGRDGSAAFSRPGTQSVGLSKEGDESPC
jgi:hypothetical protein